MTHSRLHGLYRPYRAILSEVSLSIVFCIFHRGKLAVHQHQLAASTYLSEPLDLDVPLQTEYLPLSVMCCSVFHPQTLLSVAYFPERRIWSECDLLPPSNLLGYAHRPALWKTGFHHMLMRLLLKHCLRPQTNFHTWGIREIFVDWQVQDLFSRPPFSE